MSPYIVINEDFATLMSGRNVGNAYFNYAITSEGEYVCSIGNIIIFPDEFRDLAGDGALETKFLPISAFPPQDA